jgi:hypothetical protein
VYSVSVSAFVGGSKPSRFGNVRGDVAVSFSCDPDIAWKLVCLVFKYLDNKFSPSAYLWELHHVGRVSLYGVQGEVCLMGSSTLILVMVCLIVFDLVTEC